mmetsp:Transcript_19292/g.73933  ORF Transcript_19292/g.73933 Transcript_19292/m.73933 type:complete len:410 (-) Transcript_19292:618-1847(-)
MRRRAPSLSWRRLRVRAPLGRSAGGPISLAGAGAGAGAAAAAVSAWLAAEEEEEEDDDDEEGPRGGATGRLAWAEAGSLLPPACAPPAARAGDALSASMDSSAKLKESSVSSGRSPGRLPASRPCESPSEAPLTGEPPGRLGGRTPPPATVVRAAAALAAAFWGGTATVGPGRTACAEKKLSTPAVAPELAAGASAGAGAAGAGAGAAGGAAPAAGRCAAAAGAAPAGGCELPVGAGGGCSGDAATTAAAVVSALMSAELCSGVSRPSAGSVKGRPDDSSTRASAREATTATVVSCARCSPTGSSRARRRATASAGTSAGTSGGFEDPGWHTPRMATAVCPACSAGTPAAAAAADIWRRATRVVADRRTAIISGSDTRTAVSAWVTSVPPACPGWPEAWPPCWCWCWRL